MFNVIAANKYLHVKLNSKFKISSGLTLEFLTLYRLCNSDTAIKNTGGGVRGGTQLSFTCWTPFSKPHIQLTASLFIQKKKSVFYIKELRINSYKKTNINLMLFHLSDQQCHFNIFMIYYFIFSDFEMGNGYTGRVIKYKYCLCCLKYTIEISMTEKQWP